MLSMKPKNLFEADELLKSLWIACKSILSDSDLEFWSFFDLLLHTESDDNS